jgi:hypothetical protein
MCPTTAKTQLQESVSPLQLPNFKPDSYFLLARGLRHVSDVMLVLNIVFGI